MPIMVEKDKKINLKKYEIWGDFIESRMIGIFEAESEDQAIEMAWNDRRSCGVLEGHDIWVENVDDEDGK